MKLKLILDENENTIEVNEVRLEKVESIGVRAYADLESGNKIEIAYVADGVVTIVPLDRYHDDIDIEAKIKNKGS